MKFFKEWGRQFFIGLCWMAVGCLAIGTIPFICFHVFGMGSITVPIAMVVSLILYVSFMIAWSKTDGIKVTIATIPKGEGTTSPGDGASCQCKAPCVPS